MWMSGCGYSKGKGKRQVSIIEKLCGVYNIGVFSGELMSRPVSAWRVMSPRFGSGDRSVTLRALAFVVGSLIRHLRGNKLWDAEV